MARLDDLVCPCALTAVQVLLERLRVLMSDTKLQTSCKADTPASEMLMRAKKTKPREDELACGRRGQRSNSLYYIM